MATRHSQKRKHTALAKTGKAGGRVSGLRKVSAGKKPATVSGRLDKLIHGRMRLGIVSALAANKQLSFKDLKSLLDSSDGNVSVHARKLEDAGYISCKKSFKGRKPLTQYSITRKGRAALENYLSHMEALIDTFKRS